MNILKLEARNTPLDATTVLSATQPQPQPKLIGMEDTQTVTYKYTVPKETTCKEIRFRFSQKPIKYSDPTKATVDGNDVTYTIDGTKEYDFLYVLQSTILRAKSLRRTVEVSHLGNNINTEETWSIQNLAAGIDKHFNRIQYSTLAVNQKPSATILHAMNIPIPARAVDLYYRDEIGNVSTSNFRPSRKNKGALLIARPRYPLAGSWNYSWYHGFNQPLGDGVRGHEGHYILRLPLVRGIPDILVDDLEMEITLPEGSTNVKIKTPEYYQGSANLSVKKTYLDTLGRPTIVLKTRNISPDSQDEVQVQYDVSFISYLYKFMAVSIAFFLLFVLIMLMKRHQFSLVSESITRQAFIEVTETVRRRSSGYSDSAGSPVKSGKKASKRHSVVL